jgi:hypothetical protein
MPSVILDGRPGGLGYYLASTQLPERIGPGVTVTGWIVLHLSGSLQSAHLVKLHFPDVAPLDYSVAGPVDISWQR